MIHLSHSFATHLLKHLVESGFLYGHHEAIVFVLLQVKPYNLTYSKQQHVGRIMARHNIPGDRFIPQSCAALGTVSPHQMPSLPNRLDTIVAANGISCLIIPIQIWFILLITHHHHPNSLQGGGGAK
jgi:hypothetical protein